VPAQTIRSELVIRRSRFLTTIAPVATVACARDFLAGVRAEMPEASHHVYGFRVGFGKTVTEGMSDDGEPTGTAGPPTLAVLRGSGIGDIALVTTRYFGGAKLGTGGLVRAYTEAAQLALEELATELKVERRAVGIELPYSLYTIVLRMIAAHHGNVEDEVFDGQALLVARFTLDDLQRFTAELRERSAGQVAPVELD
ncbi:MAG: YigZ family protein, partial [Chloroflexi bacterium]|nr:YigZ family protein [Chloroflexota bacterium]